MTLSAHLALTAAFLATITAVYGPPAAHALAPYALTALWAVALWAGRRATARAIARARRAHRRHYHRHSHRHARPTLARRMRLFFRRLRSVRLRLPFTTARTA